MADVEEIERRVRVVVIEDHELARRGMREMLRALPDVEVVGSFATVDEIERAAGLPSFDVVMVSAHIGQTHANRVLSRHPSARLLVLVPSDDPAHLSAAARTGGDGFVMESELSVASLERKLHQVIAGEISLPPELAKKLLNDAKETLPSAQRHLTSREHCVLDLIAEGLANKQIAARLNVSEHSVKRHVSSILAKLNCTNRTLAALRAVERGLLQPDRAPFVGARNGPE